MKQEDIACGNKGAGSAWMLKTVLLIEEMTVSQISQLFGLFRIWGYPEVNVKAGIMKVRKTACKLTNPDNNAIKSVVAKAKEIFCTNFYTKEGRWPRISIHLCHQLSEVLSAIHENRRVDRRSVKYNSMDWYCVQAWKTFSPAEYLTDLDVVNDKACSATKSELLKSMSSKKQYIPKEKKRTLLRFLQSENVDILKLLATIDEEGFKSDDLVIGATPKERELKNEPRLFSLMTERAKYYITATEQLIAEGIIPYFPDITMKMSSVEVKKRMHALGRKTRAEANAVTIVTNIDFERWNLNMRHNITFDLFNFYDRLFGYNNLIARTHEYFSKCIFLCG